MCSRNVVVWSYVKFTISSVRLFKTSTQIALYHVDSCKERKREVERCNAYINSETITHQCYKQFETPQNILGSSVNARSTVIWREQRKDRVISHNQKVLVTKNFDPAGARTKTLRETTQPPHLLSQHILAFSFSYTSWHVRWIYTTEAQYDARKLYHTWVNTARPLTASHSSKTTPVNPPKSLAPPWATPLIHIPKPSPWSRSITKPFCVFSTRER